MFSHLYNRPLSPEELDVLAVIDRIQGTGLGAFLQGEPAELQAMGAGGCVEERRAQDAVGGVEGLGDIKAGASDRGHA